MNLLPMLGKLFLILFSSAIILFVIRRTIKKITKKQPKSNSYIFETIGKILRLLVLIATLIMGLAAMGVDVSALVAGLGLSGFALSFAFKDILSNILSGLLLMLYHPFKKGQIIKVDSHQGEVLGMDLRYVTLIDDNQQKILVPTTMALTKVVIISESVK